jgi:hypothetical protein
LELGNQCFVIACKVAALLLTEVSIISSKHNYHNIGLKSQCVFAYSMVTIRLLKLKRHGGAAYAKISNSVVCSEQNT